MEELINKVVANDIDSAANPANAEFACLYAQSNYRLCKEIMINGKESSILMDYLQKQTRNFDFSEVHPCENCGYVYCDNELCKQCSELVSCEVCSELVTVCDINLRGVCSDCVENADDYDEQREMQNEPI